MPISIQKLVAPIKKGSTTLKAITKASNLSIINPIHIGQWMWSLNQRDYPRKRFKP
jgi:hypothetical protein